MKTFYRRKRNMSDLQRSGPHRGLLLRVKMSALLLAVAGIAYAFTSPDLLTPLIKKVGGVFPEPKNINPETNAGTPAEQPGPDPKRAMAPQGTFPLQRGMALVSRLSNPNALAPGQGSDRNGSVLGVYDARDPSANGAPAALADWVSASNTIYRHPDWTNARMGEIFGVEIDNSVPASPQVFVGSTGTFVGYINGAAEYAGNIT